LKTFIKHTRPIKSKTTIPLNIAKQLQLSSLLNLTAGMDSSTESPSVPTKKLGEPKPEPEPALHAEQELLPLSKFYLSSAPASLKSLSRELKPERMRLKFEGVGEKLDSRWNRIVVPKKNKYYRMSVSPEVAEFGRRELHANLKKESMKWHRPPEMDYWVRDYPALSKAKVPKGWRALSIWPRRRRRRRSVPSLLCRNQRRG
jgi:hypothetical protein